MGKRSRKNRFRTAGANALKDAPIQSAALTISPSNGGQSSAAADFDPKLEYVAGYGQAYSQLERRIPSQAHDPKVPEVTFETYRQMLNDPEVCSDIRTLVQMALAHGVQFAPFVESGGECGLENIRMLYLGCHGVATRQLRDRLKAPNQCGGALPRSTGNTAETPLLF